MKRIGLFSFSIAALVAAAAACSDTTAPSAAVTATTDSLITADVAATSGDAMASTVETMIGNEGAGGFQETGASFDRQSTQDLTVQRVVTCYDSTGKAQSACHALTTDSAVIQVTVNGSRRGTRERGKDTSNYTVSVHRTQTLTITGLLGQETSRTHNGSGASHDTTTFTGTSGSGTLSEAATDSIINVVFNLPRSSNPWPVSGSLIRNSTVSASLTVAGTTQTKSTTRRAVITFPADAQGNVSITIGTNICSLNLVTHKVTCP